jgi:hypothetical protein
MFCYILHPPLTSSSSVQRFSWTPISQTPSVCVPSSITGTSPLPIENHGHKYSIMQSNVACVYIRRKSNFWTEWMEDSLMELWLLFAYVTLWRKNAIGSLSTLAGVQYGGQVRHRLRSSSFADQFLSLQLLNTETWILGLRSGYPQGPTHYRIALVNSEGVLRMFTETVAAPVALRPVRDLLNAGSHPGIRPRTAASLPLLLTFRSNYTEVTYWLALSSYHFRSPLAESNEWHRIWKEVVLTW